VVVVVVVVVMVVMVVVVVVAAKAANSLFRTSRTVSYSKTLVLIAFMHLTWYTM